MKRIITFVIACLLLFSLVSCSKKEPDPEVIFSRIGVNVDDGTIEVYTNSHGGFLGDGETYAKIVFSDDVFCNEIKNNAEWSKLPLTPTLNIVVYGGDRQNGASSKSFIRDENDQPLIPNISDGYYFFKDRHDNSKNEKDDTPILDRASVNFTLAIYDSESKTLYFYEIDT